MKDVLGVLKHLGYGGIRPETTTPDVADWRPIKAVNGRFGTTDETHILTRKQKATCRLVDAETGQLVATARRSCLLEQPDE
jgi:phage terminase Nu1 subunit (DNA packaging protein)